LRDVSLEIPAAAFMALAGPSGSGKTALLHLVGALDTPNSGSVEVDEQDLGRMTEKAKANLRLRRIGLVFQNFNLVPVLSVAENIELPLLFRQELKNSERQKRSDKC
jgi:putative ABC transport system ATP-binding protein